MDNGLNIQKEVRDNAEELQTFMQEMKIWREETKNMQSDLKKNNNDISQSVPAVRKPNKTAMSDISTPLKFKGWNKDAESESEDGANKGSDCNEKKLKSLHRKEKGNAAANRNKWDDAIHHYTEAINIYPYDPTYYCNRALCFLKTNQIREAETDCTTALQLDKTYVKAYHRRALARDLLDQIPEAIVDLEKALAYEEDNDYVLSELHKLKEKHRKQEQANEIRIMKERDKMNEKYSKEKMNEQSMDCTAIEGVTEADDRTRANAEKEKGNAFAKSRRWQDAVNCYTEAISLYSKDDVYYANRALCFLKLNRPKGALLDSVKALQLNQGNVKALHRKGLALTALERLNEARDTFLEALALEPQNEVVEHDLRKLNECLSENKQPKMNEVNHVQKRKSLISSSNEETNDALKDDKLEEKKCKYADPSTSISKEDLDELLSTAETLPQFLYPSCSEQDESNTGNSSSGSLPDARKTDGVDSAVKKEVPSDVRKTRVSKKTRSDPFAFKFAFSGDEKQKQNSAVHRKNQNESQNILEAALQEAKENQKKYVPKFSCTEEVPLKPTNCTQFKLGWVSLEGKPELQYKYLKKIRGDELPSIFGETLESPEFSGILSILSSEFIKAKEPVFEYLKGLSTCSRFGSVVLFSSETDKNNVCKLLDHCELLGECSPEDIKTLRNQFFV